jgi:hypothetical protein
LPTAKLEDAFTVQTSANQVAEIAIPDGIDCLRAVSPMFDAHITGYSS